MPPPDNDPNERRKDSFASIYDTVRSIPSGQVCTYGRIADLSGLPRRARLVGTALRQSTPAMDLPWHRVVRADGRLAFDPGTDHFDRQARRLRAEGVPVVGNRVNLDTALWDAERCVDAVLWGPRP